MEEPPSAIVAEIEELWERLRPLLMSIEDEPREGTWSIKDIYAHLGRWDLVTALAIGAHADGRPTEDWDACFNAYTRTNARWAKQDADLSIEEARARCKAGHGRLVMALWGLNNEDWDRYVSDLVRDVRDHYRAHLEAPLEFAVE